MASINEEKKIQRRQEIWRDRDLTELIPRGEAYREAYGNLGRWAAEQTGQAFDEARPRGFAGPLSPVWQQARFTAARIAHDIYVQIGNTARAYVALLPDPPPPPAPVRPVVDVELPPYDEPENAA